MNGLGRGGTNPGWTGGRGLTEALEVTPQRSSCRGRCVHAALGSAWPSAGEPASVPIKMETVTHDANCVPHAAQRPEPTSGPWISPADTDRETEVRELNPQGWEPRWSEFKTALRPQAGCCGSPDVATHISCALSLTSPETKAS